jgi:hypothetical protein
MALENDIEVSAENSSDETKTEKTAEQLMDENYLESLDESAEGEQEQQAENEFNDARSDVEALSALLQAVPFALHIVNYKNMAAVFSADNCQNLSQSLVPVLYKHGWGMRVIQFLRSGAGIEEAALLFVLIPMSMALMQAYELDTKQNEKEVKDSDSDDEPMKDGKVYETENSSNFKMAGNIDDVKNG